MRPSGVGSFLIVVGAGLGLAAVVVLTGSSSPDPARGGFASRSGAPGGGSAGGPAPASPSPDTAESTWFEQSGFRVEMEVTPLRSRGSTLSGSGGLTERENADIRFPVREQDGGRRPLAGLRPLAWLVARKEGEPLPDRAACKREINGLIAGRLARAADVNLNEYLLVTLDDNNSLSIIDPQVESSKTKTIGMISLPSKGADLVLASDRRKVYVSLPGSGSVAAADINTKMARYVDVEGDPWRVLVQPDEQYVWVGDRGAGSSVTAIDAPAWKVAASIEVGAGPHGIAFRDDSRYAFVLARGAGTLSVIDVHTLTRVKVREVGPDARSVVWSALSRDVTALSGEDGSMTSFGDDEPFDAVGPPRALGPGISTLSLTPEGDWGFAIRPETNEAVLVEVATHRAVAAVPTAARPTTVHFSEAFAYISHAESEGLVLVDLTALRQEGKVVQSTVTVGQNPPGASGDGGAIAPTVVNLPEGGGVMILNPVDRSIYHFMEGMNAPMGAYRCYPWTARGLVIVDRTLQEVEEGVYGTDFPAPGAGPYTVAFLVPSSPQLFGCFDLDIARRPASKGAAPPPGLELEALFRSEPAPVAGRAARLRLGVREVVEGTEAAAVPKAIDDLMVLVFRGPLWQWRRVAEPVGHGVYEVEVTFPEPGQYSILVGSRSRGLTLGRLPGMSIDVGRESSERVSRGGADRESSSASEGESDVRGIERR